MNDFDASIQLLTLHSISSSFLRYCLFNCFYPSEIHCSFVYLLYQQTLSWILFSLSKSNSVTLSLTCRFIFFPRNNQNWISSLFNDEKKLAKSVANFLCRLLLFLFQFLFGNDHIVFFFLFCLILFFFVCIRYTAIKCGFFFRLATKKLNRKSTWEKKRRSNCAKRVNNCGISAMQYNWNVHTKILVHLNGNFFVVRSRFSLSSLFLRAFHLNL